MEPGSRPGTRAPRAALTAAVLLDIHNYFHFNKFMEAAREAIGAGTFAEFAAFHRERAARMDGDDET